MPTPHQRWLIHRALLTAGAFNLVVTAGIAWLSVSSQRAVPLWGIPLMETTTFWNVVGTLFLLPLITCMLTAIAIRRDVRLGSLTSVSHLRSPYRWLGVLPPARFKRGATLGAVVAALLAPPMIFILIASDFPELTPEQFVVFQTAFAVALGALITPVVALYEMADPANARDHPGI